MKTSCLEPVVRTVAQKEVPYRFEYPKIRYLPQPIVTDASIDTLYIPRVWLLWTLKVLLAPDNYLKKTVVTLKRTQSFQKSLIKECALNHMGVLT